MLFVNGSISLHFWGRDVFFEHQEAPNALPHAKWAKNSPLKSTNSDAFWMQFFCLLWYIYRGTILVEVEWQDRQQQRNCHVTILASWCHDLVKVTACRILCNHHQHSLCVVTITNYFSSLYSLQGSNLWYCMRALFRVTRRWLFLYKRSKSEAACNQHTTHGWMIHCVHCQSNARR
jgi:hypothetical protein